MEHAEFDRQPNLIGPNLALSALTSEDFAGLYHAASDPLVWAGHPAKNRYQENEFRTYFAALLESGSTLVIRDKSTDTVIGCSRYYVAPGVEDDISIGFTFLQRDYWGGTTNREFKTLMFDHAFRTFETVWLHIGPDNIRSQRATRKLGAVFSHEEVLDLSNGPVNMFCYRLDRSAWRQQPTQGQI